MDKASVECLKPVLESINRKELEYLYYLSLEGKEIFDKFSDFSGDKDLMEEIDSYYNIEYNDKFKIPFLSKEAASNLTDEELINKIIDLLDSNIKEGIGLTDKFLKGLDNYVNQLKLIIEIFADFYLKDIKKNPTKYRNIKIEEYVEGLNSVKSKYLNIQDNSCKTAIELEEILISILLQNYISTLNEKELKKIQDELKKELEKIDLSQIGIDNIATISPALLIGNLIFLRQMLGFTFHKILAIVLNAVSKAIFGKGLAFAANAAVQRFIASFLSGPFSWIIITILTIPTIIDLINPRRFDRYIPVVLFIYFKRQELEDFWKELQYINNI